jgi:hypothetical protein
MLERLANVIYWTTSTIALLLIPFLAWGWYVGPERERPTVLVGAGIAVGICCAEEVTCRHRARPSGLLQQIVSG